MTSYGVIPDSRRATSDTSMRRPVPPLSAVSTEAVTARRAQVLQANEPPGIGQLQARLDQHLFEKRVAHLDGGAQLAVVLEAAGREAPDAP